MRRRSAVLCAVVFSGIPMALGAQDTTRKAQKLEPVTVVDSAGVHQSAPGWL